MVDELRLLSIHAHPDDEASKGAGTVARYSAEGVRTTLVCCTGGEEGEILNPAMDRPEVRDRLGDVRLEELRRSVEVIGFDELVLLGYRDSGMPDSESNFATGCFAAAPIDEATGRLVEIIRAQRPHVILTYGDEQSFYPHPDHIRVHEASVAAWEAAGDPGRYPDAGQPWTPSKLYYSAWSQARFLALHQGFIDAGLESPFQPAWFERQWGDENITTRVDITDYYGQRSEALRAHATQIDPTSPFWFGLSDDVVVSLYSTEDWILARSEVDTVLPEDDLFAGLR